MIIRYLKPIYWKEKNYFFSINLCKNNKALKVFSQISNHHKKLKIIKKKYKIPKKINNLIFKNNNIFILKIKFKLKTRLKKYNQNK